MAKGKRAQIKGTSRNSKKFRIALVGLLIVVPIVGIAYIFTQYEADGPIETILLSINSFFEINLLQIGPANKVLQLGIALLFGGISVYFIREFFKNIEFETGLLYTSVITLVYGAMFFLIVSGMSFSQTDMFYWCFAILEILVAIGVILFRGRNFFINFKSNLTTLSHYVFYQAFAIIPIWLIVGFLVDSVEKVEFKNFFRLLLEFLTFLTPFVAQMIMASSLRTIRIPHSSSKSSYSSTSSSSGSSNSNSYSNNDQAYNAYAEQMRTAERHEKMQRLNDITTFSNNPDEVDAARKELYDMGYYDNV